MNKINIFLNKWGNKWELPNLYVFSSTITGSKKCQNQGINSSRNKFIDK